MLLQLSTYDFHLRHYVIRHIRFVHLSVKSERSTQLNNQVVLSDIEKNAQLDRQSYWYQNI